MSAIIGRFAPSPTGRMHLGNIYAALMSWLAARSAGGRWVLRIEDLDPQRSRLEYARQIEDDLHWLGLNWDEGGIDNSGENGPYLQSQRQHLYAAALERLKNTGLTYPCHCTRADIMASQAPHQSDGRVIYAGTCRPSKQFTATAPKPQDENTQNNTNASRLPATRLYVPDREICFDDLICGAQRVNLANVCGDFVLQRGDGAWAYQLAVVVDDALMGITQVVRGNDLLSSAAQQIYLYELLGYTAPEYAHIPLLVNEYGQRLSKRDNSLNLAALRTRFSPRQLVGRLASIVGLAPDSRPISPAELIPGFKLQHTVATISIPSDFA